MDGGNIGTGKGASVSPGVSGGLNEDEEALSPPVKVFSNPP